MYTRKIIPGMGYQQSHETEELKLPKVNRAVSTIRVVATPAPHYLQLYVCD